MDLTDVSLIHIWLVSHVIRAVSLDRLSLLFLLLAGEERAIEAAIYSLLLYERHVECITLTSQSGYIIEAFLRSCARPHQLNLLLLRKVLRLSHLVVDVDH